MLLKNEGFLLFPSALLLLRKLVFDCMHKVEHFFMNALGKQVASFHGLRMLYGKFRDAIWFLWLLGWVRYTSFSTKLICDFSKESFYWTSKDCHQLIVGIKVFMCFFHQYKFVECFYSVYIVLLKSKYNSTICKKTSQANMDPQLFEKNKDRWGREGLSCLTVLALCCKLQTMAIYFACT